MAKRKRVTVEPHVEGDWGWHLALGEHQLHVQAPTEGLTRLSADTLNAALDKTAADARADEREQCLGELGVAQASGCSVLIVPGVVYAIKVLRRGAE